MLHAFFARLLLFEQFALARHVAAVALGEHVLALRSHRLPGDDAAADRQLEIYHDLVQRYPTSPHAPEALLRLAIDAEAGSGVRASSLYSRLLQRYPGTPQATLARNRMNELVRANPTIETAGGDVWAPTDPVAASPRPANDRIVPAAPIVEDKAPVMARRLDVDTRGRSLAQASAGNVGSKAARCRYTAEFRNVGFITRFVLTTP